MMYQKELDLLKTHVKAIHEKAIHMVKTVSFKAGAEIVTTTDLFIESNLIKAIKENFPGDTFLSEEFYKNEPLKNRTWLIDPIDGTSNYAVDLNLYVVQIALYDQNDLSLSFIYYPNEDKTFYAIKGEGAYLNDERITVLDNKKPANVMLSMVGITNKHSEKTIYEKLLQHAIDKRIKLRMLGSIGLELSHAATGIFSMFYTNVKNLWDLAPGVLLAKEAGAVLFNEKGKTYQLTDEHLFVCREEKYKQEILQLLNL